MNASILYLSIVAVIAINSCQQKIRTSGVPSDSLTHQTESKNDTIMKKKASSATEVKEVNQVYLQIEPKVFKAGTIEKARLRLTNNLKETVYAGAHYFIEYYSEGGWERVKAFDELVFIGIEYHIAPAASREFEINLNVIPYNFVPGKYRITKSVGTPDKKEILVSTEFTVE